MDLSQGSDVEILESHGQVGYSKARSLAVLDLLKYFHPPKVIFFIVSLLFSAFGRWHHLVTSSFLGLRYKCRWCHKTYARTQTSYHGLWGHRDGKEARPVCTMRHKAIAAGVVLTPSYNDQLEAQSKNKKTTLDSYFNENSQPTSWTCSWWSGSFDTLYLGLDLRIQPFAPPFSLSIKVLQFDQELGQHSSRLYFFLDYTTRQSKPSKYVFLFVILSIFNWYYF